VFYLGFDFWVGVTHPAELVDKLLPTPTPSKTWFIGVLALVVRILLSTKAVFTWNEKN
jgi:hypothetical protein